MHKTPSYFSWARTLHRVADACVIPPVSYIRRDAPPIDDSERVFAWLVTTTDARISENEPGSVPSALVGVAFAAPRALQPTLTLFRRRCLDFDAHYWSSP